MDRENPLLQTDFMKGQGARPAPPAARPTQPAAPSGGEQTNPLMQTEFMTGRPATAPAAPSEAPQQPSPAVDKALHLTTGRPPAQDMAWSDVGSQAIRNVPGSAVEFGKGLIQPFLQPVETAQTIGQLGKGLYSKGRGLLGYERDIASEGVADAMGQFFKERYGDLPSIKRTLAEDPVGAAADFSTILTGGGALAARAPGAIGTVGQAARSVGSAIDPLSVAMKAPAVATKVAMTPVNWFLSGTSGASTKSLNQALSAGMQSNPAFWDHLSGRASPGDVVEAVKNAVTQVAKERSDNYLAGMGSIASNAAIPYDKVDDALRSAAAVGMSRGRVVDQEAADMHARLAQTISDWRNHPNTRHNLEDFDLLKRRIRDIGYAEARPGSPARRVADDIAKAVKESIPDKKYAQIMEQYGEATRELNDLNRDLAAGRSTGASLRKILKGQDSKHKSNLMERVAAIDPNIPYMVAGQELNPLWSSGLRGQMSAALSGTGSYLVHPAALAGMAASSPRALGSAEYAIGTIAGAPGRVYDRAPLAAQGVFQAGRAEEVAGQAAGGRIQRASGGRISPEAMADRIMGQIDKARKELQAQTGTLLNHDDETIVRALKVANERI